MQSLERLVPAVRAGFAADSLRADVERFIGASAPSSVIEEVVAFFEDGATAALARAAAANEPTKSLNDFARGLMDDPPPEARVRVVAEWVRVQGAGDFYVLMDQALSEGAHTVLAEFRPDAPGFVPLSGDPLFDQLEASFEAALVSFLHRYEGVSDDLIEQATAEYAGESGRWYVETYSLAVAEALRSAAQRTTTELRVGR